LLASGQQRKASEKTNVFFHTPYSYFSAKSGRLTDRNIPVAGDLRWARRLPQRQVLHAK
jgi:hypothetical protein